MISQIDILKQKFQNSETADTRVEALHEICWFYAFNDSAEELASYLTDAKKILESEVLSPDYFRHHDILTAFHKSMAVSFSDALEYALEIRLKQAGRFEGAWKWRIHYLFGVIQSYIGNFDDAFFEFQQVHDIAREQNDLPGIHNSLEGIGFVYGYMEDYDNAIEYYLQSLEIANQCAYSHLQFNSNVNLGYTYILTDELDKAESTSQKALAIGVKNGDRGNLVLQLPDLPLSRLNEKNIRWQKNACWIGSMNCRKQSRPGVRALTYYVYLPELAICKRSTMKR